MQIIHIPQESIVKAAQKAAEALNAGELILYPTDTVYGFGVDAMNVSAVHQLQHLKGRPATQPILIVLPTIESIEKYAVLNNAARILAEKFLPGPLSLILPAKPTIPAELRLNGTIGVRIPNDPFCLELARTFGRPYTTTSANLTQHETPTTVSGVLEQFGEGAQKIALAIDDGERSGGMPSTIISCVTDTLQVVREGVISKHELGL